MFISHALAGDWTLAEVRDAAGHANVSITITCLQMLVYDEAEIGTCLASIGRILPDGGLLGRLLRQQSGSWIRPDLPVFTISRVTTVKSSV